MPSTRLVSMPDCASASRSRASARCLREATVPAGQPNTATSSSVVSPAHSLSSTRLRESRSSPSSARRRICSRPAPLGLRQRAVAALARRLRVDLAPAPQPAPAQLVLRQVQRRGVDERVEAAGIHRRALVPDAQEAVLDQVLAVVRMPQPAIEHVVQRPLQPAEGREQLGFADRHGAGARLSRPDPRVRSPGGRGCRPRLRAWPGPAPRSRRT